jgi:hypothetical protein
MSNPSGYELISHWFAQTLDEPATITGRMGWWFSACKSVLARDHFCACQSSRPRATSYICVYAILRCRSGL